MRLGGPVFDIPDDPQAIVNYHRKNGFSAAYLRHIDDPLKLDELKAAFAEADIMIAEYGAYLINILDTDEALRKKNIHEICNRLEYADNVGARCCVMHGGSYETGGWGKPHPDNLSEKAFEQTVKAVQHIIDTVQPNHTWLVMETSCYVFPDNPDLYLHLIQAIDRPNFGVHFDPVNVISSPTLLYHNGEMIQEWFAKLGPYIVSSHAKDVVTHDHYLIQIDETYAGNGALEYGIYLTELIKPNKRMSS